MNREDLYRILRSEIFLNKDGQLHAAHIILGYKPIFSNFQSPKHLIKAKDPRLLLIDIVVPRFLTGPPPEGTHNINLIDHQIDEILQVEEEVISSNEEQEEPIREPKFIDLEEDFSVFD